MLFIEEPAMPVGSLKLSVGTGKEATDPRKAMFASHFDDKRGSRVRPAD